MRYHRVMVNENLMLRAYRLLAGGLSVEDTALHMQPRPHRHLSREKRRRANGYVTLAVKAAAILASDFTPRSEHGPRL